MCVYIYTCVCVRERECTFHGMCDALQEIRICILLCCFEQFVYVYVHIAYAYVHITYVYVYVHIAYAYVCVHIAYVYVHHSILYDFNMYGISGFQPTSDILTCMCMHTHRHACVCIHTDMHGYVHTQTCMCMYTHRHACVCTHTDMHVYAHSPVYTQTCMCMTYIDETCRGSLSLSHTHTQR